MLKITYVHCIRTECYILGDIGFQVVLISCNANGHMFLAMPNEQTLKLRMHRDVIIDWCSDCTQPSQTFHQAASWKKIHLFVRVMLPPWWCHQDQVLKADQFFASLKDKCSGKLWDMLAWKHDTCGLNLICNRETASLMLWQVDCNSCANVSSQAKDPKNHNREEMESYHQHFMAAAPVQNRLAFTQTEVSCLRWRLTHNR